MLLSGNTRDIMNSGDVVILNGRLMETSIVLLLSCTTLGAGKARIGDNTFYAVV